MFHRFSPALAAALVMSGFVAAHPASAMAFRAGEMPDPLLCGKTCPLVVVAAGTIDSSTPRAFETFMRDWAGEKNVVVLLDSVGGGVVAAMELGRYIRSRHYGVAVGAPASDGAGGARLGPGECFSACVYAFMGGVRRIVPDNSRLGIHRMFADVDAPLGMTKRTFDNGSLLGVLEDYATSMNVSADLVAATENYGSDTMHILTRDELAAWKLTTPR